MTGFNIPGIGGVSPNTSSAPPGSGGGGGGSLIYVSDSVTSGTKTQLQIAVSADSLWVVELALFSTAGTDVEFAFNNGSTPDTVGKHLSTGSSDTSGRVLWSGLGGDNFRRFTGALCQYRTPDSTYTVFELLGTFNYTTINGFYENYGDVVTDMATLEINATAGAFREGSILHAWKLSEN